MTCITALLFTLFGILAASTIIIFITTGQITMCYCPVNRKSFKKDFLLKPLYSYRKRKLARRLNI
jgi:hypothetical protein